MDEVPIINSFNGYKEFILTGGEPLLNPDIVISTVKRIKEESDAPIYVYTAGVTFIGPFLRVLEHVDGITLTLHTLKDATYFKSLNAVLLDEKGIDGKSLRLNVFGKMPLGAHTHLWDIKEGIRWLDDCPLPENEVLMRLK